MKKYNVECFFSKDHSFKRLLEANSINDVIDVVQQDIRINNFYRNHNDNDGNVYDMGKVKHFEVKEIE